MINWRVRVANKTFWLALIPAVLVLVQVVLDLCGVTWSPELLNDKLINLINALFVVLSILGVVNDPTTKGLSDSARALSYTEPRGDDEC